MFGLDDAAAIIGISDVTIRSIKGLYDILKAYQGVPDDIEQYRSELAGLSTNLSGLSFIHQADARTREKVKETGVADALENCGRSCDEFRTKLETWIRHGPDSFRDKVRILRSRDEIQKHLTQIRSASRLLDSAVGILTLNVVIAGPRDIRADSREYQQWFAPWLFENRDPSLRSQHRILRDKANVVVDECGSWLKNRVLPQWISSSQHGLWIHGAVGTGKSVLCSQTIYWLRQTMTAGDHLLLVPAIFSFDAEYTSRREFLQNTLLAKFCSLDPLPQEVRTAREAHIDPPEISDVDELIVNIVRRMDSERLRDGRQPFMIIITIDAIDEVPYLQQRRVLNFVNDLISLNQTLGNIRVRAVVFSRYDTRLQELCSQPSGWQRQDITELALKEDILKAVSIRLERELRPQHGSGRDIKLLAERIASRAKGMFRLAGLYVDYLVRKGRRQMTTKELNALLGKLPRELYGFYDEILLRIDDEHVQQTAIRALRWLLYSARPMSLPELGEAASLPEKLDQQPDEPLDLLDLVDSIAGLIQFDRQLPDKLEWTESESPRVTIAHFSVAEYLTAEHLEARSITLIDVDYFRPRISNEYIALSCLAYVAQRHCTLSPANSGSLSSLELYCIQNWSYHVASMMQATRDAELETSTTTSALALKIQNSCWHYDVDLYADQEPMRNSVIALIEESLLDKDVQGWIKSKILDDGQSLAEQIAHTHGHHELYNSTLSLGQFRLLLVHPSMDSTTSIKCSLIVDAPENRPQYHFLSYVWGDATQTAETEVNGHFVQRTVSLQEALLDLRQKDDYMVLWCDQLSINQADVVERGDQIQSQASVVSQAVASQCWLDPKESNNAVSNDIQLLLSNQFWTRTWIMQELILAREVLITLGRRSWTLADAIKLIKMKSVSVFSGNRFSSFTDSVSAAKEVIATVQQLRQSRAAGRATGLEELVYAFRYTQTRDPRDRFFAVLSLLPRQVSQWSDIVDYSKPWGDIAIEVAKRSLQSSSSWDALAINSIERNPELPSWGPEWQGVYDAPLNPGVCRPSVTPIFSASKQDYVVPTWPPKFSGYPCLGDELSTHAILVDRISSTTPVEFVMTDVPHGYGYNDPMIKAVFEGRLWNEEEEQYHRMPDHGGFPNAVAFVNELARRGNRVLRRYCLTDKNYVGNVPDAARPEDLIVVLPGAKTPHVLRPVAGEVFKLVGECYINGLMDGEADEMLQRGELEEKPILII